MNRDETSPSIQSVLFTTLHNAAALTPHPSPTCHRRRESRSPKPTPPGVLAWGRGRIRFLGSAAATARLRPTSSTSSIGHLFNDASDSSPIVVGVLPSELLFSSFPSLFNSYVSLFLLVLLACDLHIGTSKMDLMLLFCTMFLYLGIKFIITKLLFFQHSKNLIGI
jgi:hypothetical protein